MMDKKLIRREVLAKRKVFSSKQLNAISHSVFNYLKQLGIWQEKQVVHIYLPIEAKNEIDTWQFVEWLIENGHEVWASHLPSDESKDGFCQISKTTTYQKDRFGAPLPLEKVSKHIKPSVVILPCLAADKNGNRLGYGSGWYDKFLAQHPGATKIGLVPEMFLLEQIPHEPHDKKLDILITQVRILEKQNEKS